MKSASLQVCKACTRLTANGGGFCTRCIRENRPPKGNLRIRPGRRPDRTKYPPETVKEVIHTYLTFKVQRVKGPVAETAKKVGISASTVQHILTYYNKENPPQLT